MPRLAGKITSLEVTSQVQGSNHLTSPAESIVHNSMSWTNGSVFDTRTIIRYDISKLSMRYPNLLMGLRTPDQVICSACSRQTRLYLDIYTDTIFMTKKIDNNWYPFCVHDPQWQWHHTPCRVFPSTPDLRNVFKQGPSAARCLQ